MFYCGNWLNLFTSNPMVATPMVTITYKINIQTSRLYKKQETMSRSYFLLRHGSRCHRNLTNVIIPYLIMIVN